MKKFLYSLIVFISILGFSQFAFASQGQFSLNDGVIDAYGHTDWYLPYNVETSNGNIEICYDPNGNNLINFTGDLWWKCFGPTQMALYNYSYSNGVFVSSNGDGSENLSPSVFYIPNTPEVPEILFPYTVNDVGTVSNNQGVQKVIGGYQTSAGGFLTSKVTNTYGETEGVLNWEILTYFNCVACTFPSGTDYPTLYFYHENPLGKELKPYYSLTLPVQKNKDDVLKLNIITNANGNVTRLFTNSRTGQKITGLYWEENTSIPNFNMETDYVILSKDALKEYRGDAGDYFIKTNNPPTYGTSTTLNAKLNPISLYPTGSYASFPYRVNGSNISSSPVFRDLDLCNNGIQDQNETSIDTGGICDDIYHATYIVTGFDNDVQVSDNFKYEGSDLVNDLVIKVSGDNPLNQFDSYKVTLYQDNKLVDDVVVSGSINFSCDDNCPLFELNLNDFNFLFAKNHVYTFKFNLTGKLFNPVIKYFTVGYNILPDPFSEENLTSGCNGDIGCSLVTALKSSLTFLFVPSDSFINLYKDSWNDVKNRVPFVYLDYMLNYWSSIASGTATTAGSLSVNIGGQSLVYFSPDMFTATPIAHMIRDFLTTVAYILFVWSVYKRAYSLFDTTTVA